MIFASDNWSGASDKVLAALADAAKHGGPAYSGDPLTKSVERQFAAVFEREVSVFFVGTGTAANALALSAYARPGGVVFCHREAHSNIDEAGAVGLFGGGLKLHLLDGDGARISAETLDRALALYPEGNVHHGLPVAVTLGDLTELGQTYAPQEIAAIAEVAHRRGLAVHIDGARFGNAVAALGVTPAELTWKAGVDAMSFGGTKNGCLAAEAVASSIPSMRAISGSRASAPVMASPRPGSSRHNSRPISKPATGSTLPGTPTLRRRGWPRRSGQAARRGLQSNRTPTRSSRSSRPRSTAA